MGHIRLGRLPKTRYWRGVMESLDSPALDAGAVAAATAGAAERRLQSLGGDPSISYCYWLLARIAWASRSPDFPEVLRSLGIEVDPDSSVIGLITKVNEQVRIKTSKFSESGPFRDLASLALRRTLSETIGQHPLGLFGASVEDFRQAVREYASPEHFGVLARRFLGDFFARTLRYFVDMELSNHVGIGHSLATVGESQQFGDALDLYARQSSRIVQDFAADWYGKHNWESGGDITWVEAKNFVAHALRKLRTQIRQEGARV